MSESIKLEEEAFLLVDAYHVRASQADNWEALLVSLKKLYAQQHSFTFFREDDAEGVTFTSLDEWSKGLSDDEKAARVATTYTWSGWVLDRETMTVMYSAFLFHERKLLGSALVRAQLVREDGGLRYRHADIRFRGGY